MASTDVLYDLKGGLDDKGWCNDSLVMTQVTVIFTFSASALPETIQIFNLKGEILYHRLEWSIVIYPVMRGRQLKWNYYKVFFSTYNKYFIAVSTAYTYSHLSIWVWGRNNNVWSIWNCRTHIDDAFAVLERKNKS